MASEGSQILNTMELLGMERIHDKLIRIGVAHLPLMSTKQCARGVHSLLHFAYTCIRDLFMEGGVIYLAEKIIR